jgi:DNA invertase Pin-like site-specific DNA recombinase
MPPRKRRRRPSDGPLSVSLYLRLSLDKEGTGLAVERQEQECRALAERNGWTVRHVFSDNDISATSGRRRPGFEALLESEPEGIVVWHLDRLVRLTTELERVLALDVDVHGVTSGHLDLSNPAGRAVARTVTAWSQYEGEQKAERQYAAAAQRARAGRSWWSSRPFGYEMDGTLRKDEAKALAQAYADVVAGLSLRAVVGKLNASGHLTCRGNPWRTTTLKPVLLNPRNAAIREYDGEEVGPAAWKPVVPEQTFRAAARILSDPSRRRSGGFTSEANLLTGWATCGACEGRLKAGWVGKKGEEGSYPVYTCRERSCVAHPVREADDVVLHRAVMLATDEAYTSAWPRLYGELNDEKAAELVTEERSLEVRLTEVAEDYAAGTLTRAQMQIATAKMRGRLDQIQEELAEVGTVGFTLTDAQRDTEFLFREVEEMSTDERRQLVQAVFRSVTLLPRGRGVRSTPQESVLTQPRFAVSTKRTKIRR